MHRIILAAVSAMITVYGMAQQDPVTITATGYGRTMDEAITASVRSALEQTYGVFLTSDTRIEMKEDESSSSTSIIDEMAVLTSGNIVDYSILSSEILSSGEAAVTTECTIALEPMQSFVKSKGQQAEFAGGMFGRTIKLRELNISSEEKAMQDLVDQTRLMLGVGVDFEVAPGEPQQEGTGWVLPLTVHASWNENFLAWREHILKTLEGIAMDEDEVRDFTANGQSYFTIALSSGSAIGRAKFEMMHFRNHRSVSQLLDMMNVIGQSLLNFELDAGVFTLTGNECWEMILDGEGDYLSGFLGVPASSGKDCSEWDITLQILDAKRPVDLSKYSLLQQEYYTGMGKVRWSGEDADSRLSPAFLAGQGSTQFLTGGAQERGVRTDDHKEMRFAQMGCQQSTMSGRSNEVFSWNLGELDRLLLPEGTTKSQATLQIRPQMELSTIEKIQQISVNPGKALKLSN